MKRKKKNAEEFPSSAKRTSTEDLNSGNIKRCKLNKSAESNNSQEGKRVFYRGENSTMCHQCQRNDKGRVVHCTICKSKRFCVPCMKSWYPLLSEQEIAEKCPVCRGNCNCKKCLRTGNKMMTDIYESRDDVVKHHFHILKYLYPWFKTFHTDQLLEIEYEAKIKGIDASKLVIPKALLNLDENIHCNKCNSLIVDLHRSCKICSYILCLNCSHKFKLSTNENPPPVILCSNPSKKHKKALELKSFFGQTFMSQLLEKLTQITTQNNSNFSNNDSSKESNSENILDCLYSPVEKEGQMRHFQKRWCKGKPVIVRDVRDGFKDTLSWEPMVMWRALRDFKLKDLNVVNALDCRDLSNVKVGIRTFFTGYEDGLSHADSWPQLLQLIDFPPASSFNQRLPRHLADIITSLPLKEFTHPNGSLNLIDKLDVLNDNNNLMRPRMCISYGTREELFEGDSVTKIQCRMTDVVNIMTHTTEVELSRDQIKAIERRRNQKKNNKKVELKDGDDLKRKEDYGGALWDIWRREDVLKLKEYLIKHASEFVHYDNEPVLMVDDEPICADCFYLTMEHKNKLKEEYGIETWTFEQNLGEAVFIPAGCPYQVRNLKSCIKVAIDFISPESFCECINLPEEFRVEKDYNKPELEKMSIYTLKAISDFDEQRKRNESRKKKAEYINGEKSNYESYSDLEREENIPDSEREENHSESEREENHSESELEENHSDSEREENHHDSESEENHPDSEREENHTDLEREENHNDSEREENDITKKYESWSEQHRAFLIELLWSFNSPNHRDITGWKETCWIEILKHFNKEFPLANFSIEQLIEEEQALEKAYREIKWLQDHCGFVWDFDTKKVMAQSEDDDVIKNLFEMNSLAEKWHGKTCFYYDEIDPLYEGFISEDFEGPGMNEDVGVEVIDDSTEQNISFQAPDFLQFEISMQFVENESFYGDSIPSNHEPFFVQNNSPIQPPNSSQLDEVSPQNLHEPCFIQNNSPLETPNSSQVESPQNLLEPCFNQNNSPIESPNSTRIEKISPKNLREYYFTQNNLSIQSTDFPQTERTQNIGNDPYCTQNKLPNFAQVEMSPKNNENEPLHQNLIPPEPNLPNFTQNNSPVQTRSFPQAKISPQNNENEPLHCNLTPSAQKCSCIKNTSSIEPPDFQSVENEPIDCDHIPSNQEPSSTQNNSSIKTREFPQVGVESRILIPQEEASVHETSKWKGIESQRSETNNYVNTIVNQDEISRMRLELECKRYNLEMKYSFKNAMDIFDSLDGFSFEDYDRVSELFLRDEKIRNAFIDVKEEYKARWISLRIKN